MTDATTLLIIEDHKDFREAIHRFLELSNIGVHIMEACSGEEGVLIAKKVKPKIVVTDFLLGGINGIETARQIKQDNSECKIIMLTMFDPKEVTHMGGRDKSISTFISKSDIYDELVSAIEKALRNN